MEIRVICVCETVKAQGHIVKMDMPRECVGYKKGVYVKPEKKEQTKEEEMTSPDEYHGPELTDVERAERKKSMKKRSKKELSNSLVNSIKRLKNGDKITVRNPQNDEVKTFVKKGAKRLVLEK